MQFVEAIVQCICECTVAKLKRRLQMPGDPSAPTAQRRAGEEGDKPPHTARLLCRVSEIREEAKQLLDIFGLLSLPSVIALTKRPLKRGGRVEERAEEEKDAGKNHRDTPKSAAPKQKAVAGLRLVKTPLGKAP